MDSIGVAVITYRAKEHLPYCLPKILESSLKPRVLVVNSSSEDGTVELANAMGAETHVVPRREFNHGFTREIARHLLGTDYVVMMTPDAYPEEGDFLEKLLRPLLTKEASVSYARQIPHHGATLFEQFSREFNYPEIGHIRSIEESDIYGAYTFFCSNSCAAYRNSALDEAGGFPTGLFGEDTQTVARLLRLGHKIAYTADAVVRHSHDYTLRQEFQRNFDIGYSRVKGDPLLSCRAADTSRGKRYTRQLLRRILKEKPHLLPYACLQTAAKFAGYQIGRWSRSAPLWFKKRMSSQDFYWDSIYCEEIPGP